MPIEANVRRQPDASGSNEERALDLADLIKFAAVAAVLAMLFDALIGHALLWQNDPYWTYWVTDTFLITTVFGIGTALLGRGVARGALITVIQMLVLTTYYWSLSPIGLPADPEWLGLQHTWVTGPPVHFAVYYLGYLTALWLWRRRTAASSEPRTAARGDVEQHRRVAADAIAALITALAIVLLAGLAQTIVLAEFPGVTWFVMRTVILVPFTLGWWALAGRDWTSSVVGGLLAASLLVTYGHYLGPIGLPDSDLRIIAQDSPPADLHWLSYTEELLIMGPILVLVALAGYLAAARWHGHRWTPRALTPLAIGASVVALGAIAASGVVTAQQVEREDRTATVTAGPDARVRDGSRVATAVGAAELRVVATQANTKRTPLPPHDSVELTATVAHTDGTSYDIVATDPVINDPLGRFGTWGGVAFDRWHHGRSGIGTSGLDATRSEVSVYALGELRADGELIATGVPIHAMTVHGAGAELHVGDPASPIPALPGGHLRIVWDERDGDSPEGPERARHLLGGVLLAVLIAAALNAVRREAQPTTRDGRA